MSSAGFLVFLLIFFSGILTMPGERCLGRTDSDARSQFYGWRAYGFGEIRAGRFPLWNPYEFLGMPFIASFQSAMFYPTNWLCAVMPLGRAINLGIILNLFLSGLFTYLWCRRAGLRWVGATVAAAAYVFGAPQFLRVFEGHWSFLARDAVDTVPVALHGGTGRRPMELGRGRGRRGGGGDAAFRGTAAVRLLRRDRGGPLLRRTAVAGNEKTPARSVQSRGRRGADLRGRGAGRGRAVPAGARVAFDLVAQRAADPTNGSASSPSCPRR